MFPCMSRKCPNCIGTCFKIQVGQWGYGKAADIRSGGTNRITRGLVLTRPSVDRKKAHLCTNGFLSSLLVPTCAGNLNDIFVFLFTRRFQRYVGCLCCTVMCVQE